MNINSDSIVAKNRAFFKGQSSKPTNVKNPPDGNLTKIALAALAALACYAVVKASVFSLVWANPKLALLAGAVIIIFRCHQPGKAPQPKVIAKAPPTQAQTDAARADKEVEEAESRFLKAKERRILAYWDRNQKGNNSEDAEKNAQWGQLIEELTQKLKAQGKFIEKSEIPLADIRKAADEEVEVAYQQWQALLKSHRQKF